MSKPDCRYIVATRRCACDSTIFWQGDNSYCADAWLAVGAPIAGVTPHPWRDTPPHPTRHSS